MLHLLSDVLLRPDSENSSVIDKRDSVAKTRRIVQVVSRKDTVCPPLLAVSEICALIVLADAASKEAVGSSSSSIEGFLRALALSRVFVSCLLIMCRLARDAGLPN